MKQIAVIGAGFAGLSAASYLAKAGYAVTVVEQHPQPGGRARQWLKDGFVFDMGPSWYWMPDVFERWFGDFGHTVQQHYELVRLDPSYRIWFPDGPADIPAQYPALCQWFEDLEPGAGAKLGKFMAEAEYKYQVGMGKLVYKPGLSLWEFADAGFLRGILRMQVFSSMAAHIRAHFRHPKLVQLMEFPALFLGAVPGNTPALYSLMNYADIRLGTWYPMGGMHRIVEGMASVAQSLGVQFRMGSAVQGLPLNGAGVQGALTAAGLLPAHAVVATADYYHVETNLLEPEARQYSERYWQKRTLAPSALVFYLGIEDRLPELRHHNLFFDADFGLHAHELYTQPKWPAKPLFYVSRPSATDPSVAPPGMENLFVLIPVAPGLTDTDEVREQYYQRVMDRLTLWLGRDIRHVVRLRRDFAHRDFQSDYNSFRGNAYGLANTLFQTAIFKPRIRNRKVPNLFYAGQFTVPGPGVPPSLISGRVVADVIKKTFK